MTLNFTFTQHGKTGTQESTTVLLSICYSYAAELGVLFFDYV